mmetsp:Transcript_25466/g.39909  ORF Transcript_25466/g.39909 Transcript_25466/m.39909 type:complete len:217 (-) Transcript_25466:2040-2690(-)
MGTQRKKQIFTKIFCTWPRGSQALSARSEVLGLKRGLIRLLPKREPWLKSLRQSRVAEQRGQAPAQLRGAWLGRVLKSAPVLARLRVRGPDQVSRRARHLLNMSHSGSVSSLAGPLTAMRCQSGSGILARLSASAPTVSTVPGLKETAQRRHRLLRRNPWSSLVEATTKLCMGRRATSTRGTGVAAASSSFKMRSTVASHPMARPWRKRLTSRMAS